MKDWLATMPWASARRLPLPNSLLSPNYLLKTPKKQTPRAVYFHH
jgi:hypothetical protein